MIDLDAFVTEISESVRRKLEELLKEAEAEIQREGADAPRVEPIRYTLKAA